MSEFTKGPWEVKKENPIMVVMPEHAELGCGHKYASCGGGNGEANAHLIAAAPDMHEAIEAALRIPELWCPVGEPTAENEGEYQALSIMFNNFNEALMKAKGESQ